MRWSPTSNPVSSSSTSIFNDISSSGVPRTRSPFTTKRTRADTQSLTINHKRSKDEDAHMMNTITLRDEMNRVQERALQLKEKELALQQKQIELDERQAGLQRDKQMDCDQS